VLDVLRGDQRARPPAACDGGTGSAITDEDLQLALYLCYELHYGGLDGVDAGLEWDPALLSFRLLLERRFEASLRALAPSRPTVGLGGWVTALAEEVGGPSLSTYVADHATVDQFREFVVHRSAYQLKEADPHTWALPRLRGAAKRCLALIQAGEYGAEDDDHVLHAELFADVMRAWGLDARPNTYLERLPAVSLAVSNVVSMLGLHRRLRGGLAGHLALFEMTSVEPMRRYVAALERLSAPAAARRFYEVHVLADAVHEQVAAEMLQRLLADEPELGDDVAFGIGAGLVVERAFAEHLLGCWAGDESSLRPTTPG